MSAMSRKSGSKSCANCRAIKRRCDRKFPHCGQCLRLQQECSGYRDEWDLVFRDQTGHTIQRTKKKVVVVTRDDYESKLELFSHSSPTETSQMSWSSSRSKASGLSPAVPPGSMIGNQLFTSYLHDCFPASPDCSFDVSHKIISSIYMLPEQSIMLEKAKSALSCVFLSKIHQDKSLLQYGLSLYNQAIQGMSKALSRKAYSNDIIYACLIFSQIETHHCPESLAQWYTHIEGLSAIMKFYRPKDMSCPIIAAIYGPHQKLKVVLTKFTYLPESIVPWLREPGEGLLHELIQILTDLSCLAAAIDNVDPLDHQAHQSLLDDCLALHKRHMDFYKIISSSKGDLPMFVRDEIKTGLPATDDLFGPAYRFNSIGEASLFTCLWTSFSYFDPLFRRFQTLAVDITGIPELLRTDKRPPTNAANDVAAFYISKAIRCLPYCTQQGMNAWPMFYGLLAMTQAARVYSHIRDWERFMWTQDAMRYCASLGLDRANRMREIWWNYWFQTEKHNFYRLPCYTELSIAKLEEQAIP